MPNNDPLQKLSNLVRAGKITIGEKTAFLIKFRSGNLSGRVNDLCQRTRGSIPVINTTDMENFFKSKAIGMSRIISATIFIFMLIFGFSLYYHIIYGINYSFDVATIMASLAAFLEIWHKRVENKIKYAIINGIEYKPKVTDRLVMHLYGLSAIFESLEKPDERV